MRQSKVDAIAPDPIMHDPVEISDFLLEVTRRAYAAKDSAQFCARFRLPLIVGSLEGDIVLSAEADVRDLFLRMCRYFDDHQIKDLQRKTIAAKFEAENIVQATFVSRHVLPGYILGNEILAHGRLHLVDGVWKIAESRYATDSVPISLAISRGSSRLDTRPKPPPSPEA